jgi:ABC-2 type transport system ATP-binding protein
VSSLPLTSPILEVSHLGKTYGAFRAVDDVSFDVREGEIVGLLGPNGAGKSTTILMILGLIAPCSGAVRIFGKDFDRHREEILSRTNFCGPAMLFPGRLTVFENLMIFARLYDVRRPAEKIETLLRLFQIEEFRDTPVVFLSSGQTTLVGLCKALLNDPKLLLLDEPMANLSPNVADHVKQTLMEVQQRLGTAIVYTSHNMFDVEEVCARVIFLAHGRVVLEGTPLAVTRHVLDDERSQPALREVFLKIARSTP